MGVSKRTKNEKSGVIKYYCYNYHYVFGDYSIQIFCDFWIVRIFYIYIFF